MNKKVVFNQKQLKQIKEESLNINVDTKGKDVASALRDAKTNTEKVVGSGKDINYVISGNEMNETKTFKKKELDEMALKNKINEGKIISGKDFKKLLLKK